VILVFWSDLKDWYRRFSTRSFTYFLGALGIIGAFTNLQPQAVFGVLMVLGFWLGLACGKETFSSSRLQPLIFSTKLKPVSVVAGKVVFVLLLGIIHILLVLPLLLLTVLYWGVSFCVLIQILVLVEVITALVSAFALMAANVLTSTGDGFLGEFMLGGYLLLTAVFQELKRINPFYSVLQVLNPELQVDLGYAILLNFLLLLGSLIAIWVPYRTGTEGGMRYDQNT